jgi:hypothetical protein
MTRNYWLNLTPSILVASAVILSTQVASLAAKSGWLVLTAPLLLALAVVGADILASRLSGTSSGPSPAALILGATFLLASLLVTLRDPNLVKTLIPFIGVTAWVALLRPTARRNPCLGI